MKCKYSGCSGLTSITIPNSVTSIANIPANAVLIQSEGGSIKVQGLDEGTQVNVYSTKAPLSDSKRRWGCCCSWWKG